MPSTMPDASSAEDDTTRSLSSYHDNIRQRTLLHSLSNQSLASSTSNAMSDTDSLLSLPAHIHITTAAENARIPASKLLSKSASQASFSSSTSSAVDPSFLTTSTRFLRAAITVDRKNEAQLLTPHHNHLGGGVSMKPEIATSLLHSPRNGELSGVAATADGSTASLHSLTSTTRNATTGTHSLLDSLSNPLPASGYSLLDGALERRKKKLLNILNGFGSDHNDGAKGRKRIQQQQLQQYQQDSKQQMNFSNEDHDQVKLSTSTSAAALGFQSENRTHSDGGSDDEYAEDDYDDNDDDNTDLNEESSLTSSTKYSYLIEDTEIKSAEQAKVARLLQVHRGNMTSSIPLNVQLNLARLHYDQYLGRFKPEEEEGMEDGGGEGQGRRRNMLNQGSKSARVSKTHLLSTPIGASSSTSASVASLLPSGSQSHRTLNNASSAISLHSNASHMSNTSSTYSMTSTGSRRRKKITFLTSSLSDASINVISGHRVMSSVNDPYSKSPSKSYQISMPYADRFSGDEMRELRKEVEGGCKNESSAMFQAPSSLIKSTASVQYHRAQNDEHAEEMKEKVKKLHAMNWESHGNSNNGQGKEAASLLTLAETLESNSSHTTNTTNSSTGPSAGFGSRTSERLTGEHSNDTRLRRAMLSANITPGPGEYDSSSSVGSITGGSNKGRSQLDRLSELRALSGKHDEAAHLKKKERMTLDLNCEKFASVVRDTSLSHIKSPGPAAYFPKHPSIHTMKVRGGVRMVRPHVPPLSSSAAATTSANSNPGVGTYNITSGSSRFGTSRYHINSLNESAAASLAKAGAASHFVGFGSSASRDVNISATSTSVTTMNKKGTRSERLIDFHPMPKLTQADWDLIAEDEKRGGIASVMLPAILDDAAFHAAETAHDGIELANSVYSARVKSQFQMNSHALALSSGSSSSSHQKHPSPFSSHAHTLITHRPAHIIPKYIIPKEILSSHDEATKLSWIRARARANNANRTQKYLASKEIAEKKKQRFIELQDRELKITLRNRLRITQSRWLVLLVHGIVFSVYRRKHDAFYSTNEKLKSVLVLQYYWRLKQQRLVSSQRFRILFQKLRKSFLWFVVAFRVRRKKRSVNLLQRFLCDYIDLTRQSGTRRLLNLVHRFKACVRIVQRFIRASLRKIYATRELCVRQMEQAESQENVALNANGVYANQVASKAAAAVITATGGSGQQKGSSSSSSSIIPMSPPSTSLSDPSSSSHHCASVREVLLAELQSSRATWEQDKMEYTEAEAALAATSALHQSSHHQHSLSISGGAGSGGSGKPNVNITTKTAHSGSLKKAATNISAMSKMTSALTSPTSGVKSISSSSIPSQQPSQQHRTNHLPHHTSSKTTTEQLVSGGSMLVRGPGGRATVVPIFTSAVSQRMNGGGSGGSSGGDDSSSSGIGGGQGRKVAVTSLAEYSLHLSDTVRRAVAAEACRLKRRKHMASIRAHETAMQKYLTRNGSALHNGIELARMLLTGSSARIELDRATFLQKYPPPRVSATAVFDAAEIKAMVYDAYLMQAHLDEERIQAQQQQQEKQQQQHPISSRTSQQHHQHHGQTHSPSSSLIKFQPGHVTLPIRIMVSRAPLPGSALDTAKYGRSILHMLHILSQSGANIGLGLSERMGIRGYLDLASPHALPMVPTKQEHQQAVALSTSHAKNSGGSFTFVVSPPQGAQHHFMANMQQHGGSSFLASSASRMNNLSGGSGVAGGSQYFRGGGANSSMLQHHHDPSPSHSSEHDRSSQFSPSGSPLHHIYHEHHSLDEYDWRSKDVAPIGLLAFHATMNAVLRVTQASGGINISSSNDAGEIDAYWNNSRLSSNIDMSDVGLHVMRSQALQHGNSHLFSNVDTTTTPKQHHEISITTSESSLSTPTNQAKGAVPSSLARHSSKASLSTLASPSLASTRSVSFR